MCYICGGEKDVENINLYVMGSEGVNLCYGCRMILIELIRGMARIGTISKKAGLKIARKAHKNSLNKIHKQLDEGKAAGFDTSAHEVACKHPDCSNYSREAKRYCCGDCAIRGYSS